MLPGEKAPSFDSIRVFEANINCIHNIMHSRSMYNVHYILRTLSCDSITPLGSPVVPDCRGYNNNNNGYIIYIL